MSSALVRDAVPEDGDRLARIFRLASLSNGGDRAVLLAHPDAMRRGIATTLVDDVVGFARSTGVARVAVDANPHARAFYESVGFEVDGPAATEFGPGLRMHRDV